MTKTLVSLAVAALFAVPASAHDLWLSLPSGAAVPQVHVHYGHPDDLQPPQADKLVEMTLSDARGARAIAPKLAASRTEPILVSEPVPGAGAALLAARYDNGFWVKTPDGEYRNTTRRLVPEASDAITSVKFAKLVAGPGAPWAAPVGHELEIVPLEDPTAVRAGGTLHVRVLFRGAPVAGAEVVRTEGEPLSPEKLPRFATDASGVASVPVEKAGGVVLVASRRVAPSVVPALADADLYSATLAFAAEPGATN